MENSKQTFIQISDYDDTENFSSSKKKTAHFLDRKVTALH